MHNPRRWKVVVAIAVAMALLSGCEGKQGEPGATGANGVDGKDGAAGPTGPAGALGATGATGPGGADGTSAPTAGTLTGTVTDGVKADALAGVTVTAKDSGGAVVQTATTDATGDFTMTVPFGTLSLTFAKAHYTSPAPMLVGALAGQAVTLNVTLNEASSGKPSVTLAAASNNVGYGTAVTLTATATDPDGDALTYAWADGTALKFTGVTVVPNTPPTSAVVTMPTLAAAFAKRTNPTDPGGYTSGYTVPDRFGVLPISADTRAGVSAKVTVSDGRGQSTTVSLTVNAAPVLTGARNVAYNTRVYLNSGHADPNSWTLTAKPTGSTAALDSASSRTPSFVADQQGVYTVTEGSHSMDIYAGDWKGIVTGVGTTGPDSVAIDSTCTTCHNGTLAPNTFTPWKESAHATMFSMGIDGTKSTSYGAGCVSCHTVGYDPAIANGGFDDVATTANWVFPSPLSSSNWTNLVTTKPAVARLGNIQCENCHGPQTSDAHMLSNPPTGSPVGVGAFKSPRIGFSAEVCATCHASGAGHHQYSEWNTTDPVTGWGHGNRGGAAKGLSGTKLNGHCGRCHTAQGFAVYVDNLKAGTVGNIASSAAVVTDVGPGNVEPVTCTACHDPHDKTNPNQLRVFGNTGLLPSGFAGYGMGKGALCATCHNSRNGAQTGSTTATYLHADGETYNGGNPTGYSAPHMACQADVFTGNNAYFMGSTLPMASKHSAIEDTCVGCHMALNPKSHLSHGTLAPNKHEFRILDADKGKVCASCHGATVNGEGVQASVEAGLHALATKMGNAAKAKINAAGIINVRAYDAATDLYSSPSSAAVSNVAIDTAANPVVSVGIEEGHGQIEFHLTFTNPISIQFVDGTGAAVGSPKSMTSFGVQLGSLKDNQATPVALYPLSGNMVRAGWNYFLIEGDQSAGLHNPTFAQQVLNNTLAQNLTN